jgi:hypothetical protein
MEVTQGGQSDAAGRKLSIDTIDSALSLDEKPSNEQTVVRMAHGVGSGIRHTAGVKLFKCEC